MSRERIYHLLVTVKQEVPSKEIKDDIDLIADVATRLGAQAEKTSALMRATNIELVETALHHLLANINSGHAANPHHLERVLGLLLEVQAVFNKNLKNYHEHDANLKAKMGQLGTQLDDTIDFLKEKKGPVSPGKGK